MQLIYSLSYTEIQAFIKDTEASYYLPPTHS